MDGELTLVALISGSIALLLVLLWVYMDTKARGCQPGGWMVGVFFLGVVFLPLWFFTRPKLLDPVERGSRYPDIRQALGLTIFVIVLMGVLGVLAGFFTTAFVIDLKVTGGIALATFSFILLYGVRKTDGSPSKALPFPSFDRTLLLPMALTIGGLFILIGELGSLLARLIPLPWGLIEPFYEAVSTDPVGAIFAIVIVAPLAEEMLFRGLILRGFLNRYTFWRSIIVSALLFGAVHENLWQFPSAVIIGLLLAWWFAKTRSLWPCVLGHALFNGLGVLWLHVGRLRGGTIGSTLEFLPLWIDLIAGAAVAFGIWFLIRMLPSAAWEPDAVPEEVRPQLGDRWTGGGDEDVWKST